MFVHLFLLRCLTLCVRLPAALVLHVLVSLQPARPTASVSSFLPLSRAPRFPILHQVMEVRGTPAWVAFVLTLLHERKYNTWKRGTAFPPQYTTDRNTIKLSDISCRRVNRPRGYYAAYKETVKTANDFSFCCQKMTLNLDSFVRLRCFTKWGSGMTPNVIQ